MKLATSKSLPQEYNRGFIARLLQQIDDQVNNLTDGKVNAVTNSYTAAPTGGTHAVGDFVRNTNTVEIGTAPSAYVILGWICTVAGTPGTFTEVRADASGSISVAGPGSSTDNAVARWNGTGGNSIQNSVVLIGDTGAITGVTTLGMSGQLTSTLVTGTSPLVVASTTKVANLNADLLDDKNGEFYLSGDYGSTGILTGGGLSIGTGGAGVATTFTIAAGTGRVVDPTTNPPTVTDVTWSAKTNVAVTNIATQLVTFVAIDSAGNVQQSATIWTPAQNRDYIAIGVVVHSNQTTVNAVNQGQGPLQSLGNQFVDLSLSLGTFNITGNVFSANGANLKLNKSAGSVFRQGANYTTLTDNPHVVTLGALTQASLRMQNQTGAGSASTTDIDPNNYDVGGVTTSVPANKFSILRIFSFVSNLVAVQRGQAVYNSLAEAKAAIQTETYVTNSILSANGILRGFLVVRQGTTDLTNSADAFFIETGRFGGSAGVGGLSVSTLQNVYDNSSTPEILTDATRLALTVRRGSGADSDNVFEGMNGAGTPTFTVTGGGAVSVAGQLTSTLTTGTAPLVVASTTKVSNLNADLLDDQSGAYYLDSANFTGTNWTDLTDNGSTTLHTHVEILAFAAAYG